MVAAETSTGPELALGPGVPGPAAGALTVPRLVPCQAGSPPGGCLKLEDLLQSASEFAAQAIQSLITQSAEDSQHLRGLFYDYVELAYRLEIHFLFPNLGDYERGLLVALGSARSALLVGLRNGLHWRTPDQRREHEANLLRLKDRFLQLRAEVTDRKVRQRLTSLQQQVLDSGFLSIQVEGHTAFLSRAALPPEAN